MTPIEDNVELLKELKMKGYNLFFCRIFIKRHTTRFSGNTVFSNFSTVFLYSSYYGLLKPEREIYVKMLQKFSLNPAECIFIDDTP